MDTLLQNLGIGFNAILATESVSFAGISAALPMNLVYAFVGALIGTLIGVLPGLGPVTTIAMLLPATYALPPLGGLIMLAGIYYGAQYGGSTTAILVNLPGEASSIVTSIDGYQMARQGRGGAALTAAALGSLFAGCVGVALLAAFAVPLAEVAFEFGAPEYFSLMVLGLVGAVVLSSGSLVKSIAMVCLGLLGGTVGVDPHSGTARYAFDIPELMDGISFVGVAIGVFGFAEIIKNLEGGSIPSVSANKVSSMFPTKEDFKRMLAPMLRGTGIGSVLGLLPGGGVVLASFASYAVEKKVGPHRREIGQGAIEGVVGPESANNAAAQTSFIPLLTLGIPSNPIMALMVGAMMIHNIQPGPQVMTGNPSLFWGLVVSMWVGNVMLVILNLPLIGIWVRLLTVPYRILYPAILVFSCIGVYTVSTSAFDIIIAAAFGVLGYVFIKLGCEVAPLLLGFVLGPMMEANLRRTLLLSHGEFSVFATRPLSLALLLVAAALLLFIVLPSIKAKRQETFQEA